MSFLDSINPANMLSNAAESFCDAVLPKELEFIGDFAALAVDLKAGNWMKAIEDFQDLAQDLPQQLAHLANTPAGPGNPGGDALMTPSFLEPAPPPPYAASNSTQTSSTTTTTVTTTTNRPSTEPSNQLATTPEASGSAVRPGFSPFLSSSAATGLGQRLPHLVLQHPFSQALAAPTVRGTPTSSTASPPSVVGGAQASPAPTQSAPAAGTTSSQGTSAPSGASTGDAAKMSPDEFFKLSDTDLTNAVREGKIPSDVKKNPEQMQRLQQRMNEITEMNQLITSMLKALHDMNSQVIQNIRV